MYAFIPTTQINPAERIPFQVLPVIGALVACIDIGFLLRTTLNGYPVMYHKWLLRLSQLLFWVCFFKMLLNPCNISGTSIFIPGLHFGFLLSHDIRLLFYSSRSVGFGLLSSLTGLCAFGGSSRHVVGCLICKQSFILWR